MKKDKKAYASPYLLVLETKPEQLCYATRLLATSMSEAKETTPLGLNHRQNQPPLKATNGNGTNGKTIFGMNTKKKTENDQKSRFQQKLNYYSITLHHLE